MSQRPFLVPLLAIPLTLALPWFAVAWITGMDSGDENLLPFLAVVVTVAVTVIVLVALVALEVATHVGRRSASMTRHVALSVVTITTAFAAVAMDLLIPFSMPVPLFWCAVVLLAAVAPAAAVAGTATAPRRSAMAAASGATVGLGAIVVVTVTGERASENLRTGPSVAVGTALLILATALSMVPVVAAWWRLLRPMPTGLRSPRTGGAPP